MADDDSAHAWLDQARWLYGEQRARYDSLGQQAVSLAGFELVLLGLALPLRPDPSGAVADWMWLAGVVMLLVGIGGCAWGMAPRTVDGIALPEVRESWRRGIKGEAADLDIRDQFTEHLLRGHHSSQPTDSNPISSLSAAAAKRADAVTWSMRLAVVAALLLAIAIAVSAKG